MKKQNKVLIFLISVVIVLLLFFVITKFGERPDLMNDAKISETQSKKMARLTVGTHQLEVEVVDTPETITRGLSGRTEISADGMLFVFDQRRVPGFWMKEMQFDLDLVWIDGQKIIGITKNVPAPSPNTSESQLQLYYPPGLVDKVLEIPAGQADLLGLSENDLVILDKPGS